MMDHRLLCIVTGMSGAGKTQVIRTLEDLGFYCVDNLPLDLLPKFLELVEGAGGELGPKLALCLDLREERLEERFSAIHDRLKESPLEVRIFFVDARNDVLLRRFSETRRPHPLSPKGRVADGVKLERKRLASIRDAADLILDSSDLTIHQLKSKVEAELSVIDVPRKLTVNVVSFGFSFGLPPEASIVFDVRFLPNPHFIPELRPLTGENEEVFNFVCNSTEGKELISRLRSFLQYLLPLYVREGKSYLTIAIGCTGGHHRSVAVARRLHDVLKRDGKLSTNIFHRDIER